MKSLRKILPALLAAAMVFALVSAAAAMDGLGTPESPLRIVTEADMLEFASRVTNDLETTLCAELTADLTFADWTAIGKAGDKAADDSPNPYIGVFNGNGRKLTLTRGVTIANGAFFHTIGSAGVVKNLNLHATFSGTRNIAGVAARNYGTIEYVTVEEGSSIVASSPESYAGGIAGLSGCKVENGVVIPGRILHCVNRANVTGNQYVGGIAGSFLGEMRYCGNEGTIAGNNAFGGLMAVGDVFNSIFQVKIHRL
jgi:hypothetical protein